LKLDHGRNLAQQKALLSSDKLMIKDNVGLIPPEDLFKLDIDMHGPLWTDWRVFGR
jgi:hypothetical protein